MKPAPARCRFGKLLFLATLCATSALQAQWSYDSTAQAYFITGDITFDSLFDPGGQQFNYRDILVGKNNRTDFQTLPGSYTLTLIDGGEGFSIFEDSGTYVYPDGKTYAAVHVFGNHRIETSDSDPASSYPYLWHLTLHDTSEANLNGGKVEHSATANDSSTLNASNMGIRHVYGNHSSKINLTSVNALVDLSDNSEATLTNSAIGSFGAYGSSKATLTNVSGSFFNIAGNANVDFVSGTYSSGGISGASKVTVRAGAKVSSIEMLEAGELHLYSEVDEAHIQNDSTLYVEAGAIVRYLTVNESSNVLIDGGTVDRFASLINGQITLKEGALEGYGYLFGASELNLEGGTIADVDLFNIGTNSLYNFYGQSLVFSNPTAGTESGYGYTGVFYDLAWTRPDGVLIETSFFDEGGDIGNIMPPGVTFTFVPEPSGALLVGIGLAIVGMRRRRRANL